ncbi:MAG TPA: hypothetical protein VEA69_05340, partial [Tepidisphaeraceae bacterium]|nr:hypothetical protein [Tepidisphaeraceae bacterium]
MEQRFVIVGGLADDHDRGNLIAALEARTVSAGLKLSWDWIKSSAREGWRPPLKYLNQLSASVDRDQKEGRQPPKLVLLRRLNKESRARVLTIDPDPVLVEPDKFSGPDLVEWLFSAEAGLTPQSEWVAETRLAAFICILAKLLRKKSWNKDKH